MKKSIKKLVSVIMVMSMLVCSAVVPASAEEFVPEVEFIFIDATGAPITPFASDVLSNWSPSLSGTAYGASMTFTGFYTGSVVIRLQNSSGTTLASFTESFTNRASVSGTRSRTNPTGTYRIQIEITVNGVSGTTLRNSHFINI